MEQVVRKRYAKRISNEAQFTLCKRYHRQYFIDLVACHFQSGELEFYLFSVRNWLAQFHEFKQISMSYLSFLELVDVILKLRTASSRACVRSANWKSSTQ